MEERELAALDVVEVDVAAAAGEIGDAVAADPAPVGEEFEADEVGIAGEGGGAGVGRVAVAGGAERQDLPDVLLGGGEEVEEVVGCGAEVADAAVGGQRGDVEQDAGGALEVHGSIIAGGGTRMP